MLELGQLDKRHADFAKWKVQIVAISNDNLEDSKWTQEKFPRLTIVSDHEIKVADALRVIHKGANPSGGDANAPTTFLVDGTGLLRWFYRPDRIINRLTPDELLAEVDKHLPGSR